MDDYFAKLFAGHMGISAVLANVLIDKGVVGVEELSDRFRQAHGAAARCSSGPATAHALAEIISYLDRQLAKPGRPPAARRWTPRSSADARLLDAIDLRLEALLTGQSPGNRRRLRRRQAGGRMLPACRWPRHHVVGPLSNRRREAHGGDDRPRAQLPPECLEPHVQGATSPGASEPGAARRRPVTKLRVTLRRNGVQHHRELPSSL